MDDATRATGWRSRWVGGIGGVVPCATCRYVAPLAGLCHECRTCRGCAPGRWTVCGEHVRNCGPFCPAHASLARHAHPA